MLRNIWIIYIHVMNILMNFVIAYAMMSILQTKHKIKGEKIIYLLGSTLLFSCLYFGIPALGLVVFPYPFLVLFLVRVVALIPFTIHLEGTIAIKSCYFLFYISFMKTFGILFSPLYAVADSMDLRLYFALDILTSILQLVLIFGFTTFLKKHKLVSLIKVGWHWLLVLFCPASYIYILEVANPQSNIPSTFMYSSIAVLLLLNILVIYYLYYYTTRQYDDMISMNQALMESKAQVARFRYTIYMEEELARERHEIKNKYFLLQAMLKEKKVEEAEAKLEEWLGSPLNSTKRVSTGIVMMDYMLNQKIELAIKNNIHVVVDVSIPSELDINDELLCTVLLNALDNAIEASLKTQNPDIQIRICMKEPYLVIEIKNKVDFDVFEKNPNLKTTKGNRRVHGKGIPLIKEIIKKNEGSYDMYVKDGYFVAMFMLMQGSL